MNPLNNRDASGCRFCSPTELIETANSVIGNPKTINGHSNGNSRAVLPDMAVVLAKQPGRGNGDGEVFPENGGLKGTRRIEQSIAYMREHLDQPLPVAKLAALANVSPSHFFALFKRRTGSAPIDYFTHLRMQYACRLLDTTSASVKEVAVVLGYDDPFYFSRVFKLINHVPPSRYRALQKPPPPVLRPDKIGTAESGRGAIGNGAASVSLPGNGKNHNSRIVHSL
jgi:AraC-like DNA-binding protein